MATNFDKIWKTYFIVKLVINTMLNNLPSISSLFVTAQHSKFSCCNKQCIAVNSIHSEFACLDKFVNAVKK